MPFTLADRRGLRQEVEALTSVQALLTSSARGQQLGAARAELALQACHEREGIIGQQVRALRRDGADDLELGGIGHDGSPITNRLMPMSRRQEPNRCTWRHRWDGGTTHA